MSGEEGRGRCLDLPYSTDERGPFLAHMSIQVSSFADLHHGPRFLQSPQPAICSGRSVQGLTAFHDPPTNELDHEQTREIIKCYGQVLYILEPIVTPQSKGMDDIWSYLYILGTQSGGTGNIHVPSDTLLWPCTVYVALLEFVCYTLIIIYLRPRLKPE